MTFDLLNHKFRIDFKNFAQNHFEIATYINFSFHSRGCGTEGGAGCFTRCIASLRWIILAFFKTFIEFPYMNMTPITYFLIKDI